MASKITAVAQVITSAKRVSSSHDTAEVSSEVRYHELVRQLQTLVMEKGSSASLSKKALPLVEELVVLDKYARPQLVPILRDVMKCEKSALHELLPVLMWRAFATQRDAVVEGRSFEATVKMATDFCFDVDTPEARRTALLCVLMHSILQQTSDSPLVLDIPSPFVGKLVSSLRTALDHKINEKRGFATKASWHEEKRARLLSHLAALSLCAKLFITHVFPHASMQKQAQQTVAGLVETLSLTALEYSHKAKDIPAVRQSLACLTQIAEVAPDVVMQSVVSHLPADMSQVLTNAPIPKKTSQGGKSHAAPLPCWDPLAASGLAKLCLAVLHKQAEAVAVRSPFMKTLNLLCHHSHHLVFADIVMGIVKRNGLYYILQRQDEVYGSKERLVDYTVDRVQSMLKSDHVTCSTGLRLVSALCEQHLVHAASSNVASFRPSVVALLERFQHDPFLVLLGLKASIWIAAVRLAAPTDPSDVSKPAVVRELLDTLVGLTTNVAINADQTLEYLKCLIRAAKLLPPDGPRALLIPAFTGIVEYLTQRLSRKMGVSGLYGLLHEFLLQVDVVEALQKQDRGVPVRAELDIDAVPYQRPNGGTSTLGLVLGLLDGSVSPQVSAAEQAMLFQQEGESTSVDTRVRCSKLLIESLRFVGDFGNVMVNGKGSDCRSNMLLLLVRLQALVCSQPHHVVWEAGLAMLKLCARSHAAVRVKVHSMLSGAVRLRQDMQGMLQPLLSVADMTLQLHESLDTAQRAMQEPDALVDADAIAEGFFLKHEALKQHLAVYVKFAEFKSIRLLGSAAEEILKRGQEANKRKPGSDSVLPSVMGTPEQQPNSPDGIDMLFA
eukprot:TRINITY_DN28493_c0_g1_i1.p1 TRINITY_DN28493_c0_g1~~TRINITY_DN28493_c0_g1_i1.p1  ORF type:complete len:838 (+),score=386.66 TRINITY_DN28493_c0_g1_i1:137-2650(+)